jgi:hypothetical protein
MSWKYRVMNRDGELAIYEVYYDEDGCIQGHGADPDYPAGDTLEELRANLELYCAALNKPVLEYR